MALADVLAAIPLFGRTFRLHPAIPPNVDGAQSATGDPMFGDTAAVNGIAVSEAVTVNDEGGLRQVQADVIYLPGRFDVPTGSEISVEGVRRRIVDVKLYPDPTASFGYAAVKLTLGATK